MENIVYKYLKDNNLIFDRKIIVATSGGVDSVVLLTILTKLNFDCILAHVNHHKRKESELEMKQMQNLANKLNIPFELLNYYYDNKDNFHNDSHNKRYDFFKDLCLKYNTNIIATAHHLDDQLETILIKLLSGSNLYGYGGISKYSFDGRFILIRPLLCTDKQSIYKYAKDNNLIYFEDKSNSEDLFLRNRLRHNVIPLLKQEDSFINDHITNYSNQLKEAFSFIRGLSIEYLNKTQNKIEYLTFNKLHVALKKDIICLLLERFNINRSYNLITDIVNNLEYKKNGYKVLDLSNDYNLIFDYDYAYIKKLEDINQEQHLLTIDNEVIFLNKYRFYFSKNIVNSNAKYIKLCYNQIVLPFKIRTKVDGDFISLKIGNKKLSRIFIDNKVSKDLRCQIPIILDNDDNILWVYDYAKSTLISKNSGNFDIYLVCEVIKNEK